MLSTLFLHAWSMCAPRAISSTLNQSRQTRHWYLLVLVGFFAPTTAEVFGAPSFCFVGCGVFVGWIPFPEVNESVQETFVYAIIFDRHEWKLHRRGCLRTQVEFKRNKMSYGERVRATINKQVHVVQVSSSMCETNSCYSIQALCDMLNNNSPTTIILCNLQHV